MIYLWKIVKVNKNRSSKLSSEHKPCDYESCGVRVLYVHLSYFNFIVMYLIIEQG